MLFRNDGKGESNAVQNRFTAYVVLAVQRRKSAVLRHRKEIAEFEHSVDFDGDLVWMQSQQDTDFSALMMQFEIIAFEQALDRLSKRDRYILVTRLLHRLCLGRPFCLLLAGAALCCRFSCSRYPFSCARTEGRS